MVSRGSDALLHRVTTTPLSTLQCIITARTKIYICLRHTYPGALLIGHCFCFKIKTIRIFLKIFKPNNEIYKFNLKLYVCVCMYVHMNADVHSGQRHWIP